METASTPDQAASALLARFGDEARANGRPVFVRLRPGLGLEGARRRADVWGWTAPESDAGIGVVATGRLRSLDESNEMPARLLPGLGGGLRMACLVTREGEVGWDMLLPDGSRYTNCPSEGRVLDVLRRTMGLATPPPEVPAGRLVAIIWLMTIDLIGSHRPGRLTWSDVLDANLAPEVLRDELPPGDPETQIRLFADQKTWDAYRLAAASLEECDLCDPHLAAWMDEGIFSRYVLETLPSLEELLNDVRPRLVPAAARRLGHLVHEISAPLRVGA